MMSSLVGDDFSGSVRPHSRRVRGASIHCDVGNFQCARSMILRGMRFVLCAMAIPFMACHRGTPSSETTDTTKVVIAEPVISDAAASEPGPIADAGPPREDRVRAPSGDAIIGQLVIQGGKVPDAERVLAG